MIEPIGANMTDDRTRPHDKILMVHRPTKWCEYGTVEDNTHGLSLAGTGMDKMNLRTFKHPHRASIKVPVSHVVTHIFNFSAGVGFFYDEVIDMEEDAMWITSPEFKIFIMKWYHRYPHNTPRWLAKVVADYDYPVIDLIMKQFGHLSEKKLEWL